MNYMKLFLFLIILTGSQSVLAVTLASPLGLSNHAPALTTEFGKTGTVDVVDPQGRWIRISNKKYVLRGIGSMKLEDLRHGLHVHYNVERAQGEKAGRVTRMWVEDDD